MSRHFYIGLLAVAVVVGAIFFYRTESPPPIPEERVEFGGASLRIEYATTTETRERGLGGRENIPDDYGMLFVFSEDDIYGFWMEDMLVPIDIFWLDVKGQVIFMAQGVATSTYPNVFYPTEPARFVLETAAGFAQKYDIKIGMQLQLKNLPIVSE